ncbi:MAG: hypothetical protein M0R51_14255 [Clostridia bacterium]|nr:hypothetical protein [Clostridia bacterium]
MEQSGGEKLLNAFRGSVNKSNIRVLEEADGKVINLHKVKVLVDGEYEELTKVADENRAIYLANKLAKEKEEKDLLEKRFSVLQDELAKVKANNLKMNALLLQALKVIYGTSEEDMANIISSIENEVSNND